MSGRLIILPKKSYCPWNPENVERVLRDEREHAEKIEQEAKKQKEAESRKRLNALKNGGSDEASLQHVNLFQKEEEEEKESYKTKRESVDKTFYLGNSIVREKWKNERIEKKPTDETTAKEERLKATMDPMNEFVSKKDNTNTMESIEEQSKQHKRRRKHRHEKKDKRKSKRRRKSHEEDSKDTRDLEMIELRRRRAEREERERKRQARLL